MFWFRGVVPVEGWLRSPLFYFAFCLIVDVNGKNACPIFVPMKNFIFMLFAFAMCVSTAAIADDRVTATSDIEMVVDVGKADVSAIANSETVFTNAPVAVHGSYIVHCETVAFYPVPVTDEDVGWQCRKSDDYTEATPLTMTEATDPAISRRARDGLSTASAA